MSKITSYSHLNEKYDLNFTDNNFGFTWEIFKEMVTPVWAPFFTSKCFYRTQPTARNLFKTTVHCIAAIFYAVNFTDTSTKMLRRYDNTHAATTHGTLIEVAQLLLDKYNIDITESNKNGIKWKLKDDSGGYIKFPSGCVISFSGYAKGNAIMGATVKGSPNFNTWTDEFNDPNEPEPVVAKELLKRYTRLTTSLLKNQTQKRSDKPIAEWSWTYLDKNKLSPTYNQMITRYFHKLQYNSFSFNPYDNEHIIYEKFANDFFPLSACEKELDETGLAIYEDETAFNGLGIFIMRANMDATFHLLQPIMQKQIMQIKIDDPDEFNTIYYGKDYSNSDMSNFVFRKAMQYCLPYNLQDFYVKCHDKFVFDFYSVGVDWATGPNDNTIFHFWGFKKGTGKVHINWDDVPLTKKHFSNLRFDKNKTNVPDKNMPQDAYDAMFYALYPNRFKTLKYDSFLICEIVVSPDMHMDEKEKINFYIQAILGLRDHFHNFQTSFFHYDDKCESAMTWLKTELFDNHGFKLKKIVAIKHSSHLNNEAGLADRVIWVRRRLENKPYNKSNFKR